MPVSVIQGRGGILQIVKLTALMGHVGEDKGHGAADRLLAIRDDAFDRHFPWLQHLLHFLEQGRQIPLGTAEQRTSEQDFFGETVADDPEHLMPDIGLQPIEGQDHLSLLL